MQNLASSLTISTPRLDLLAATATLARADASDRPRFAALLQSYVPPSWPPAALADVQEYFADQLEKGFALPGWWNWYALTREGRVLIGTGGFAGQPDSEGTVTLGYSIASEYEGRGYASEMVEGLLRWMAGTGLVRRVHATTFERHFGSTRVLEKAGFVCRGVSSEDAAADAERQGRGKLMLFVKEMV
jgi:[ribosomal protein S5]-alanine N-acetyltransferase